MELTVNGRRSRLTRRVLPPIHANPGIAATYRKRLEAEIDAMNRSLEYWLVAHWKQDPPELAQDDVGSTKPGQSVPSYRLIRTMEDLAHRWQSRFDDMADKLARWFADRVEDRSTARLEQILRDAGWSVQFQLTPAVRDIMAASIAENVGLIRSIASEHLTDVHGIVMRGVQQGGDLQEMTRALHHQFGVTRKRAAFISQDQNKKTHSAITRARQQEAGIQRAIWMHSGAGKEPRETHVRFAAGRLAGFPDAPVYNVAEGVAAEDTAAGEISKGGSARIWPGTSINCKCTSRPLIPAFEGTGEPAGMPEHLYRSVLARSR